MKKPKNRAASRDLRGAAAAAAAIKTELTDAFPGIKFSVTSSTFAGGDSVRIAWIDGPTRRQVEELSAKYQHGHFNGMEDIYEYSNQREDIPQAKYVQESRSMSEAVKAALLPPCQELFDRDTFTCHSVDNLAHRIFSAYAIPHGWEVVGTQPTGETSGPGGSPEHFYRIRFKDSPEEKPVNGFSAAKIQILDYSSKAVAVVGDTKAIKEKLKELGGRFNRRLSCGAGWVFPKCKLEEVKNALIAHRHV